MAGGVDRAGRTELHYAALDGGVDEVRGLIAGGADVTAVDGQGFTPLHFACQQSRADVVEILLEAGAVVDAQDARGNSPLWRAVFSERGDGAVVKRLLAAGANPELSNGSGVSPRDLARQIDNRDVGRFFADQ